MASCPCCGLVQVMPALAAGDRACCARCGTTLRKSTSRLRSNSRTLALALAALVLYPLGVGLPMLRIEQLGHSHESSVLEGVSSLLAHGHLVVGIVVFVCSIVFPVGKLVALVVLAAGGLGLTKHHRALTYRLVEWTGRWGMLDVLLLALLVAFVKIGDLVEVTPGPAALTFTLVVGLSLAASASFDPHALWEDEIA